MNRSIKWQKRGRTDHSSNERGPNSVEGGRNEPQSAPSSFSFLSFGPPSSFQCRSMPFSKTATDWNDAGTRSERRRPRAKVGCFSLFIKTFALSMCSRKWVLAHPQYSKDTSPHLGFKYVYVMTRLLKDRLCIIMTFMHNDCWVNYYEKCSRHWHICLSINQTPLDFYE